MSAQSEPEIDDRIKLARSRVMFSRLLRLSEQQSKDMEAKPGAYIDRAYEEVSKARRLLSDLRWILTGGPEMMEPYDPYQPIRFESVLIERHRKAMDLIDSVHPRAEGEPK